MTAVTVERLPDFEHTRPDGSTALLSDTWARGPAVFVWLRQCG